MKFRISPKTKNRFATTRIKNKFLLFPKIIDGEIRWLCKAKWMETKKSGTMEDGPTWEAEIWLD